MRIYPNNWDPKNPGFVPDYSSASYKTTYTYKEVESYLSDIKKCIREDQFIVLEDEGDNESSRFKNTDFLNRYSLITRNAQKEILLLVEPEDFCHAKITESHDELLVFCIRHDLYKVAVGPENVAIYIKHELLKKANRTVVVSFHELEYPIDLKFIDEE